MADFKFQCPYCGQKLEADEEWRGERSECPHCHNTFIIPKKPHLLRIPDQTREDADTTSYDDAPKRGLPPIGGYHSGSGPLGTSSLYDSSSGSSRGNGGSWLGNTLKGLLPIVAVMSLFLIKDLACGKSESDWEKNVRETVDDILKGGHCPAELRGAKCRSVEITGSISSEEYKRTCHSFFAGQKYYRGVATLTDGRKIKIVIAKNPSQIEVCFTLEENARFTLTEILARSDIPSGLCGAKCRSVRITGKIGASEYHRGAWAPAVVGGEYYRAVATLDNGRELRIMIKCSFGNYEVQVDPAEL